MLERSKLPTKKFPSSSRERKILSYDSWAGFSFPLFHETNRSSNASIRMLVRQYRYLESNNDEVSINSIMERSKRQQENSLFDSRHMHQKNEERFLGAKMAPHQFPPSAEGEDRCGKPTIISSNPGRTATLPSPAHHRRPSSLSGKTTGR